LHAISGQPLARYVNVVSDKPIKKLTMDSLVKFVQDEFV